MTGSLAVAKILIRSSYFSRNHLKGIINNCPISLRSSSKISELCYWNCSRNLKISSSSLKSSSSSSSSVSVKNQGQKILHPPTSTNPKSDTNNYLNFVPNSGVKIMSKLSETLPNIVFVLGGPGAGKGTQCSKIVEAFGFVHLSAGDLLREERNKPGSQYGELIEKHIRDGTIVPVEITCSLIERAMLNSGSKLFLIDGFPRNKDNLDGWNKSMEQKVNVLFVLFFDAEEEICVKRCLSRGELGSGRSDDNPESLQKRVLTYLNDTMPIVKHFATLDLVRKIDASFPPDEVFQEVKNVFNPVLGK